MSCKHDLHDSGVLYLNFLNLLIFYDLCPCPGWKSHVCETKPYILYSSETIMTLGMEAIFFSKLAFPQKCQNRTLLKLVEKSLHWKEIKELQKKMQLYCRSSYTHDFAKDLLMLRVCEVKYGIQMATYKQKKRGGSDIFIA